jgi:hypothetical protein
MSKDRILFFTLLFSFVLITSCSQHEDAIDQEEPTIEETKEAAPVAKEPHPYGGWYCPDNFGGFPPIDIQDLDQITVVSDRLPTLEEAQNGTALMFIDEAEFPGAKPLDIELPQAALIYSQQSGLTELIIVIQAIVVQNDTVVGYRFPSGGNGTAWYSDVDFLSTTDVADIGSAPFVHFETDINATKAEVWKAFSKTDYALDLGERFNAAKFIQSDWTPDSQEHLNYESEGTTASGIILDMWGNLYMHIDYDYEGFQFTEKMLVSEDKETNTAHIHIVSGPYPEGIEKQRKVWKKWLDDVKKASEKS